MGNVSQFLNACLSLRDAKTYIKTWVYSKRLLDMLNVKPHWRNHDDHKDDWIWQMSQLLLSLSSRTQNMTTFSGCQGGWQTFGQCTSHQSCFAKHMPPISFRHSTLLIKLYRYSSQKLFHSYPSLTAAACQAMQYKLRSSIQRFSSWNADRHRRRWVGGQMGGIHTVHISIKIG